MRTSDKTGAIAAALYAIHRDLENPRKDAKGQVRGNPNYRYLSLPALIDHIKKPLRAAQVAVIQDVTGGDGYIAVTTVLMHLTGEFVEVGPLLLPAATDAQGAGSAITYARRYALAAALNLAADEDDDGVKASKRSSGGPAAATPDAGESTAARLSQPQTSGIAGSTSPVPLSDAVDTGKVSASAEEPVSGQPGGEPGTGPSTSNGYTTKEEQQVLADRLAVSKNQLLQLARKKFGTRIQRLGDITHEMAAELSP